MLAVSPLGKRGGMNSKCSFICLFLRISDATSLPMPATVGPCSGEEV